MRQCGMAFQIAPDSDFPNLPDQQDNKSTTPQASPKQSQTRQISTTKVPVLQSNAEADG